jgi:Raf kinase inhibitor-like YbhB/YbcL family protein
MAAKQPASIVLTSPAFAQGKSIPSRFTCDGGDYAPPLAWSGAPPETRSFALVCHDPDAPSGDFYHWAAFDIAADAASLPESLGPKKPPIREAINDFGRRGYGGPCPPGGHGQHHYHFTLYALDVPHLALAVNVRCREVERAAKAHALARADLIGTYSRM